MNEIQSQNAADLLKLAVKIMLPEIRSQLMIAIESEISRQVEYMADTELDHLRRKLEQLESHQLIRDDVNDMIRDALNDATFEVTCHP